jgi:hypothetical protein
MAREDAFSEPASTKQTVDDEYSRFLREPDAAGAVEYINEQLKEAVVDGDVDCLPSLYSQRAVWRMQLGLARKAEADLLSALRCNLSAEASVEIQILLIQCYRALKRTEDQAQAVGALRNALTTGAVLSAVVLREALACIHMSDSMSNGAKRPPATNGSTSQAVVPISSNESAGETRKKGMAAGFFGNASGSSRRSGKASPAFDASKPGNQKPSQSMSSTPTTVLETQQEIETNPAASQSRSTKATKYGATTIEEELDFADVKLESTTVDIAGNAKDLDAVLSTEPKLLHKLAIADQQKLALLMGADGALHFGAIAPM